MKITRTHIITVLLMFLALIIWNFSKINWYGNNYQSTLGDNFIYNDSYNGAYLDFYNPPNTGVFLYNISAFAVNIGSKYTFFVGFVHRDKFNEPLKKKCAFKYKDGSESFVKGVITRIRVTNIARKYKYHAAFIKCPESGGPDIAMKVSVIAAKDKPKSIEWINVADRRTHTTPAEGGIAICLNTIYNQTSVWSLAEWMEVQRLMGVDKAILYGYRYLSEDILKLVKYYQKTGFLHVQPWNHGWPFIHNIHGKPLSSQFDYEGIPDSTSLFSSNNDCLYRFGNQYKYLIHIDTDEYITATNQSSIKTYADLIAGKEMFGTLYFLHTRFCVPDLLHHLDSPGLKTLRYQLREHHLPFMQRKAIFKPSAVLVFGIHEPLEWCPGGSELKVDTQEAKLHHYRYREGRDDCTILDESMLPFKNLLERRVRMAINQAVKH